MNNLKQKGRFIMKKNVLILLVLIASYPVMAIEVIAEINEKAVSEIEFTFFKRSDIRAKTLCDSIDEHVNGLNVEGLTTSTVLSNDYMTDPLNPRYLVRAKKCTALTSYTGKDYNLLELTGTIKLSDEVLHDEVRAQEECFEKKDALLRHYSYALISRTITSASGVFGSKGFKCSLRAAVVN